MLTHQLESNGNTVVPMIHNVSRFAKEKRTDIHILSSSNLFCLLALVNAPSFGEGEEAARMTGLSNPFSRDGEGLAWALAVQLHYRQLHSGRPDCPATPKMVQNSASSDVSQMALTRWRQKLTWGHEPPKYKRCVYKLSRRGRYQKHVVVSPLKCSLI